MSSTLDTPAAEPVVVPEPLERPRKGRPWWRKRPIKKATVWTHRWLAMGLGLLLVAICLTGVPILYTPELTRANHGGAYDATGPTTISMADAQAAMLRHDPSFRIEGIWRTDDVFVGMNYDTGRRVTVDGSNGNVLGDFNADHGVVGGTLAFLTNFHDCLLSCEGMPGYQSWLGATVPGTAWLGFDGGALTVSGLLIGVTALLLLFLSVSGIWLWWPGIKRWFVGVRVRLNRGRYARDYDLHQVAGMIAIPLLLLWAVTGMGFELGFVEKTWYAVTPGQQAELPELTSKKSAAPDVPLSEAEAAAITAARKVAPDARGPVGLDVPAKDDPTGVYYFWFANGRDPYANGQYPGNLGISVDRRDATRTALTYGAPGQSKAQLLWEDYNYTVHAGLFVGPWWRLVWLVLGLVPLLLAITGVSTWLYKRGARRRRRAQRAEAATSAASG